MFFLDLIQNLFPNLNIYLFPVPKGEIFLAFPFFASHYRKVKAVVNSAISSQTTISITFSQLIQMNIYFRLGLILFLHSCFFWSCESQGEAPRSKLGSFEDSVAYAVGMDIAKFYQKQGVSLDPDLIYSGMKDMQEDKLKMSIAKGLEVVGKYQQQQIQSRIASNQVAGEKFLEENAGKEGVVSLASGLQYQVLQKGEGPSPSLEDSLRVSYVGKFVDGEVFVNTEDEGGSVEIDMKNLLAGWTEALLSMKVGSRWIIYLPPDLAYGAEGFNPPQNPQLRILPYSTLIYEIELIEIL